MFNRPGVGQLLVGAITSRDYTLIQGGLVILSVLVVAITLVDRPAVCRHRSTREDQLTCWTASSLALPSSFLPVLVVVVAFGPIIEPHDPLLQNIDMQEAAPSPQLLAGDRPRSAVTSCRVLIEGARL